MYLGAGFNDKLTVSDHIHHITDKIKPCLCYLKNLVQSTMLTAEMIKMFFMSVMDKDRMGLVNKIEGVKLRDRQQREIVD